MGEMETHLIQGTKDWHEFRRSHIGSSDAPVIMGVSPWKTPYELFLEKKGLWEQEVTGAMIHGSESESVARKLFEEKYDILLSPDVLIHKDYQWMSASVDGISLDKKVVVEIKRSNKNDYTLAKNGEIPIKYYPQLQHILCVLDLPMIYYVSFNGVDIHVLEVLRDQKFIDTLLMQEMEFLDHLRRMDPPPLTNKDYTEREDQEWINLARDYKHVEEQLTALESLKGVMRSKLEGLSQGRSCRGGGITLSHGFRQPALPYKQIVQTLGIETQGYEKEPIKTLTIRISK